MSELNRLSPQSIDAEQSVLGSMLIDSATIPRVSDVLTAEDFYRESHGIVYSAIMAVFNRREPVDLVSVGDELTKTETLNQVGGVAYLATLMNSVPHSLHATNYAKIVHDKARLRRLIEAAGRISATAYEEVDADVAEDNVLSIVLEAIGSQRQGTRVLTPDDQGHLLMDLIEARQGGAARGIPSGLRNLDHVTGGFARGELTVLAARPSVGKSTMAENLCESIAKAGLSVGFFSVEMSPEMILERWLSRGGRVSSRDLIHGLTFEQWRHLYELAAERTKLPLTLIDAPAATSMVVRNAVERAAMSGAPFDFIVVDYLQLIANNEPITRGENKVDRIGRITNSFKQLARQMSIPVLLVSQLNRESEHRGDTEPQLSDLRGSGDIEQDADVVLMMWRENNDVRMKVAKQRNGPLADIPIAFDAPRYLFTDAPAMRMPI